MASFDLDVKPLLGTFIGIYTLLLAAFTGYASRKKWFDFALVDNDLGFLSRSTTQNKLVLPIVRGIFFLFGLVIIILSVLGITNNGGIYNFSFYTVWNYTALVTLFFCLWLCSLFQINSVLFRRFTWILFGIAFTNVFVVDTVMWGVLYPQANSTMRANIVTVTGVSTHGVNAIMMLTEFFLNEIIIVRSHVVFMLFGALLYIFVTWARRASGSLTYWPYPFLETSVKAAPYWYAGMTLFMILMHFIPYGLSLLKQKCFNLRPVGYEREGQRLLANSPEIA
eukprot:m.270943 g.270943  ORF g.270943 m.270943 type:complete len:281 (-) comp16265_c1_seq72:3599-4441(-)